MKHLRGFEDVLVNRGAVEETVVVVIDDIVGGGSSHLTVKFLLPTKLKHIFLFQILFSLNSCGL